MKTNFNPESSITKAVIVALLAIVAVLIFIGIVTSCSDPKPELPVADKTLIQPDLPERVNHTDAQIIYWRGSTSTLVTHTDSLLKFKDPEKEIYENYLLNDHRCWMAQMVVVPPNKKSAELVIKLWSQAIEGWGYTEVQIQDMDKGIVVFTSKNNPNKYCMFLMSPFKDKYGDNKVVMSISFYNKNGSVTPEMLSQMNKF